MDRGNHAVLLGPGDHRHIIERRLDCAESGLGKPYTLVGDFFEIGLDQARFENHRAPVNAHAAGAVVLEALKGGDGESLDALRVLGPARHVDFGRADRGGRATMHVTIEEAHRLLPRRVVTKSEMYLGIDETGHGGGFIGVDDHVTGRDRVGRRGADQGDLAVGHQNAVAFGDGLAPIAGENGLQIDDRGLHVCIPR